MWGWRVVAWCMHMILVLQSISGFWIVKMLTFVRTTTTEDGEEGLVPELHEKK
ncbi:hypothetical protein C8Q75DRAFT_787649 [Abortiporus biennis]|nr:hypothetical protein C8Q75DRAFT_787649 [Abortiporus biennis]